MSNKLSWGILGAGGIVRRWIGGARQAGAQIRAIASRTPESAQKAAAELDIPEALSYEALVQRPDIDICYVAVPHPFHKELALLAMEHKKHVLVEKPAAVTAADWREMAACARKNGVFLMEGVWTRIFPAMEELARLFTPEELGSLKTIQCAFSGCMPAFLKQHRNLRMDTAGGGLLDMGVYCLHLCDALYGAEPEAITGYASINTDENQFGVDEQAVYIARYPGQRLASMASGVRTAMQDTAFLYAAECSVELPHFWKPTELILRRAEGRKTVEERRSFPVPQAELARPDEGFSYEVSHVEDCIARGLAESPKVPHAATERVLTACDSLRAQWGLRYPFEA